MESGGLYNTPQQQICSDKENEEFKDNAITFSFDLI